MKTYFQLSFAGIDKPELYETLFSHSSLFEVYRAIRGKSGGAYTSFGSFQWTRAVKALCRLILRSVCDERSQKNASAPVLIGSTDSLAASLDYAADKHPLWLIDMFGLDSRGIPTIRRMLRRTNPGRKRSGPTAVGLNTHFLPIDAISIFWDGKCLSTPEQILELMEAIDWEEKTGKQEQPGVFKEARKEPVLLRCVAG